MKVTKYTVSIVVSIIQNYYKLKQVRFYKGGNNNSDLILDIDNIILEAKLSDKQLFVLEKCWKEGYKQEEVSAELGVSQQMVDKHIRSIKKKIEKVLINWGEM